MPGNSLDASESIKTIASNADMSILSLIASSDIVGKIVLLILAILSVWSWAIIISKYMNYKLIDENMNEFENLFWSGQVLDDLYENISSKVDNPLSSIFISAIDEYRRKSDKAISAKSSEISFLHIGQKERINQTMQITKHREIGKLESKLSFLASVGSSSVFIGLFGTVWGIIHSFQSIALSKNTSLAVVAPGIAEALVATAIGLFVAIPAVVFYNYLISKLDTIESRVDNFTGELSNLLSRAIDQN